MQQLRTGQPSQDPATDHDHFHLPVIQVWMPTTPGRADRLNAQVTRHVRVTCDTVGSESWKLMRFRSVRINNFRAIKNFEVYDLKDFVLIAGPNGCGKSCVLDAIRLLKSLCGGYEVNEIQMFFGEFQIDASQVINVKPLFRDFSKPIEIGADIEFDDEERRYLDQHAETLVRPAAWREVVGQDIRPGGMPEIVVASQWANFIPQVNTAVAQKAPNLRRAATEGLHTIKATIHPGGGLNLTVDLAVQVAFETYDPANLGVVDYHSASRAYGRETLGGIDMNIRNVLAQRRQSSLYNWQQKYVNIKAELAATHVRGLVAEKAGGVGNADDLNETLKDLFRTFFPGKEYLGVISDVDGNLSFPVRLATGEVHDLNELSSGEKELVYGYLRLRSSAPRMSTILLDEPELHLNPGLIRNLADFYYKNIGAARRNQLWLVSHSDALLRDAVGKADYSVYHMTPLSVGSEVNQASIVSAENDLEQAIIDLVGDLAAYQPRARVVILEGGGDTEFDASVVSRLFPDLVSRLNLISGGDKRRVREFYGLLQKNPRTFGTNERFYAITDRDSESPAAIGDEGRSYTWDVYHIENYLLEPQFVREALIAVQRTDKYVTDSAVKEALRQAATGVVGRLVYKKVQKYAYDAMNNAIDVKGDPAAATPEIALRPTIESSFEKLREVATQLSSLEEITQQYRAEYEADLQSDRWMSNFPGREILKQMVASESLPNGVGYELFRNLVLDKMASANAQPVGMKSVLQRIVDHN